MKQRMGAVVAAALTVAAGLVLVPAEKAEAAGVTTHAWMALEAVPLVDDPELATLLEAHLGQVEAGAHFPDSGYLNERFDVPGGSYGEEAHWHRFFDAYSRDIREDESCGDLTDAEGPCAERIAHMMGSMAHGMGDEVWDWLFEPQAPDRGESYVPAGLDAFFGNGGLEVQMDICAIAQYGRPVVDTPPTPAPDQLAEVFASVGRPDITQSGIESGKAGMGVLRGGESVIAPLYLQDILSNMPWTSANMVTAPGGVNFAAAAIAAEYEDMWRDLLGEDTGTEVSLTYPADGQVDVPATGWEREMLPGSAPDRGGAQNRIVAVLSDALPFVELASDPQDQPEQVPPGSVLLVNAETGEEVPQQAGYPRVVPYGADPGAHMVGIQPAQDLEPCTEYEVQVTSALIDNSGAPVTPHSWTFRTGGCCEDPPTSFTDVPAEHPFHDDIVWMAEQCITTGYADGTYRPGEPVTRQSMSAFMYRMAGAPIFDEPATASFPDVATSHPFFEEVEWMAAEGITTGYADGTFRPAEAVTRQSMSAFMHRLAGSPAFAPPGSSTFPDVPTSHPFFDEVEWMAAEEIAEGFEDGTFQPAQAVTRQSMSAFLHRLADGPGVGV